MNGVLRIIFLAMTTFIIVACNGNSRLSEYELTGAAMGTTYSIKLVAPPESLATDVLQLQVADTLERVEDLTSTYRELSELSVFNSSQSTQWTKVSAELCNVVEQALQISRHTGGAFDITVGPLVNLWGFGPGGDAQQPPSQEEIDSTLSRVGYKRLQTDCSVPALRKDTGSLYVDLSGWAKGYAVDELAALLDAVPLSNYLVEIGGELRALGHNAENKLWTIAIEKPDAFGRKPQTILRVTDTGIATSGDYRNFFEHEGVRYSHTIDARNGRPVSHSLAAVTIINRSAAFADSVATALLVLGPEEGPAFAERTGLAAFFLVRGKSGIEELSTTLFETMRAQ